MNQFNNVIVAFIILYLLCFSSLAGASPIGKNAKDRFYKAVSTSQGTHPFPAIYVYDVNSQQFLNKERSLFQLKSLSSNEIYLEAILNWSNRSENFSSNNNVLSVEIPEMQLDRDYVVFYDNIPSTMLESLKHLENNLVEKDRLLKEVVESAERIRFYTTY